MLIELNFLWLNHHALDNLSFRECDSSIKKFKTPFLLSGPLEHLGVKI
jgi:hypothetical protein